MSCRCKNQCSSCGCEDNRRPCTPCYKKQLAAANKAILAAADILVDYIEEFELDDDDCFDDDDYGYEGGCGCDSKPSCGCNSKPSCGCKPPCGVTHECHHKVPCQGGNSCCGKQKSCGCWGRA